QAAVFDKLLTGMPDIVRAIAEPLSKVDKVTIISTGNGNQEGVGASRLTGDIMNMVSQVPALFEILSGTQIGDLLRRIPALSGQDAEDKSPPSGATPAPEPDADTENFPAAYYGSNTSKGK